jgi:hypothetical protein
MTKKPKIEECALEARKQAALLAPGRVRDALLEKVRHYEAEISGRDDENAYADHHRDPEHHSR